jgi:hypothetical protein
MTLVRLLALLIPYITPYSVLITVWWHGGTSSFISREGFGYLLSLEVGMCEGTVNLQHINYP